MKLARIMLVAGALTLAAAACGGGGGNKSTTQPPPASATTQSPTGGATTGGATTLTLADNIFEPATLTVAAGSQVTVTNQGAALHNFSVEGQGIDQDVAVGQSESVDLSALQPGTYTMFCKYHRSLGMEGTLTISG